MNSEKIRELAARVEDHRLDFKSGLYHSNEELAKDLMAIANLLPPGSPGHIILGVKQLADDTGEIVGVNLGAERDSDYQQKVAGKLNRSPQFTFYPIQLPEGDVGVFEIVGTAERPYFPLITAGKLKKSIPLKRLGSSTADASPDEVREWVLEDRPSKDPATLLERIPKDERDKVFLVVDALNNNGHAVNLPAPISVILVEVDTLKSAAKFQLSQDRQIAIPLNAISSNIWKDGLHWKVVIDGFLRHATWEYLPNSREHR